MRRSLCYLLIAFGIAVLLTTLAPAQTVLYRARIGNYTEGATYVPTGPHSGHIAMLDGYEVWGFQSKGKGPAKKLFDTFDIAPLINFRGIAYMTPESRFIFTDTARPDRLIVSDSHGKSAGERIIEFPAGDPFRPNRFEGIVYIPQNADVYPDHLIAVSICQPAQAIACVGGYDYELRLLVMTRSGVVVNEITPNFNDMPEEWWNNAGEIWGIGFQEPDKLLLSAANLTWKMDFGGNLVGSVASTSVGDSYEGIVGLPDGNIAATNAYGKLLLFDSNMNRLPKLDRDYTIGLGISNPTGLAWNTDTKQLLILEPQHGSAIWSVPVSLKSKQKMADITDVQLGALALPGENNHVEGSRSRVMTYLPQQHQVAVTYLQAPFWVPDPLDPNRVQAKQRVRVARFNRAGQVVGYQKFFDWDPRVYPTPELWTWCLGFVPASDFGSDEFALRKASPSTSLYLVNATTGEWDRMIDLGLTGLTSVSFFDYFKPAKASDGRILMVGNDYRAVVTDMNGTPISEFNYRERLRLHGTLDFAHITSGPYTGAMAALNSNNSEVVIFRLD